MLNDFFTQINILNTQQINAVLPLFQEKKFKKNEYLIREGERSNEIYFILKGCVRSYYLNEKGDEINYCILFPSQFTTAYSSFISGQKSIENIQALQDLEVAAISKKDLEKLEANDPIWTAFLKMMAEQAYIDLENRFFQIQRVDAQTRYLDLLKNHAIYLQEVPANHLASFLGISTRHLSRIKKQLKETNVLSEAVLKA